MGGYRLSLLDVPRLEGDGNQVLSARRKTMALLAYLAVTGLTQSRDVLATFLWPEYDQSNALANLRRELSRIRESIGSQALTADRQKVTLNRGENLWLDVIAFKSKLKQASNHPHPLNQVCERCRETLRDAIALYRADFMTGFSLADAPEFDEWQFFQREEMRRLLGEALLKLIESHVERREYSPAIPYARRWLSLDSMHEPAHRWLMKLYAWSGQQSAAIRQYQDCQRILGENIGVKPEQETIELYQAIKKHQLFPPAAEKNRNPSIDDRAVHLESERMRNEKALIARQASSSDYSVPSQSIRFCTSPDGVRLAYAVVGEGPLLVKTANWLSHLEYDWNSPVWRHWMAELTSRWKFVRYDERGCGLSDWDVKDYSLDAWVRDLETVVDSLGLERFPLLGISQGASIAVAYAVRHPERVSRLVLYGGYSRGRQFRAETAEQRDELDVTIKLIKLGWGKVHPAFRQVFSMMFIPEGTAEQLHAFNELARITTTPDIAAQIVNGFHKIDVQDLAKQVIQPTLVLHAKDELRVPFEEGRKLAALIPNARLVPLESKNHILLEHEPAWQQFLYEVTTFLKE